MRLGWSFVLTFACASGATAQLRPYGNAATGFGFMQYEGGRSSSLELGLVVSNRVTAGIERMHQSGEGSESGTWTDATLRVYPFRIGRLGGFWLAGGLGKARAESRESPSAQWHMLYRFNGLGSRAAVGGDIRVIPHLFLTPALSVRRSIGRGQASMCTHPYDSYGVFAPNSCGAWGPTDRLFQAVELSIALAFR